MQGAEEMIDGAIVLTCALSLIVFYYLYKRDKDNRELKDEVEFQRTCLSIEGSFFGIIIILMAYSPEMIIILPVFGIFLVLFLRVTQIEDIEKELRENCEQTAREQMAEWYQK